MTIRTDTINGLIQHISSETGSRGFRGLRFLHEINDFPTFYVHAGTETRTHAGAGMKLCILECDIRGYTYSNETVDKEDYLRSIEIAVQTYADINRTIDECRCISCKTDEGLYRPYAICDLKVQILYRIFS